MHDGRTPDIFDHGYVAVDFADGTRAMLELCMFAEGSRWQEEISAVGPRGKIEAFVPGPTRFWPAHLGDPPVAQVVVSPREPRGPQVHVIPVDPTLLDAGDHNGSTFYQHRGFLELVRGQRDRPHQAYAPHRRAPFAMSPGVRGDLAGPVRPYTGQPSRRWAASQNIHSYWHDRRNARCMPATRRSSKPKAAASAAAFACPTARPNASSA